MATLTYDTKSSTALTADTRNSAGSLTYDSRGSNSISADSRSSAGSLTNDNKNNGLTLGLWVSTVLPWTLQFPWLATTDGQILLKDSRN